jgi:glycosyltransferase involved in cell wall biosynthesis
MGAHEITWNASPWRSAASGSHVLLLTWNLNHVNLVPALLRARRNGIPTILWGHGYSKRERGYRWRMRERVARLPTALLFYSEDMRRRYLERGFAPQRLHVAPNALDQTPIQRARAAWLASPDRLAAFRAAHGLAGPLLLFVSRLKPENRLDLLLEATALLLRHHPQLVTAIIGPGDAALSRLRAQAQALSIERAVRFVGPLYDEQNLAPWFLSADAFCFPVNAGLSILHAFGFGLPIVTSDNRARQNPEIDAVRPGENGLLYADGNARAMAEALDLLIRHPDLKARLAAGAHKTALDRTLAAMVDGMERAIRHAAADGAVRNWAQQDAGPIPCHIGKRTG